MSGLVTVCPVTAPTSSRPTPETLSYSLTLPAALRSPAIARAATRAILRAHDLADTSDAAVQVVAELTACACRFAPTSDVYLSLRYRDEALRVVLYDGNPRHTHPRLATACDTRRRAALRVLACVVKACAGDWGFGDAREPGGGTRMWAVLPRHSTRTYTHSGT